jgi:hypothetical protein
MTATESTMVWPENRLPDFDMIPDMAHPDTFLNIPSLMISSSGKK